ncbi:MAG: signal transduction histidine kinase, partial [Planctomycetota bacterium]
MSDDHFALKPAPIRVLAIDDDPVDLELLKRYLGKIEEPEIIFSGHHRPDHALVEIKQEEPFDVVLLDYFLGAMTGFDAMELVKRVDPDLPVIFLTGRKDEGTLAGLIRAGVSDYLPKNRISPENLKRAITNASDKGRLQRRVNEHARSMERLVVDLKAREAEAKSFYHVLSHELKTPLTSIREFVSIVLDGLGGDVTEKQREYLGIAKRNCDHLKTLLDDIIDITRMETGKLSINSSPMDVGVWVRNTVQEREPFILKAGLNLKVSVAKDLPTVKGDAERLSQVLNNLLSNSVKFTPSDGTITVTVDLCETQPGMVEVAVRDTGRGIEPHQIGQVFDRMYQAREEDFSIKGGLGLGLNICEGIVRS